MNATPDHDTAWDSLIHRLEAHADHVQPYASPLSAVKRRAGQRTRNHRLVAGGAALVALIAGVAAVLNLSNPSRPTMSARQPALADSPELVDSGLTWTAVQPNSAQALGFTMLPVRSSGGQAPFLAWSTTPGRSDPKETWSPALYRSDDGISWQVSDQGQFTLPSISARGAAATTDELFAFGTGAASAPAGGPSAIKDPGVVAVARSANGGASWTNEVLPVDLRGLRHMAGVNGVNVTMDMASAGDTVVAIAIPQAVWALPAANGEWCTLEADSLVHCYRDAEQQATATTVVGPDMGAPETVAGASAVVDEAATSTTVGATVGSHPTRTMTLAEAGIDPRSVEASGTPQAFVSIAGAPFQSAELPVEHSSGSGNVTIMPRADGFVAVLNYWQETGRSAGQRAKMLQSSDGTSWTELGDPPGSLVGVLADGTMIVQGNSAGLFASTDGAAWSKVIDVTAAPVGSPGRQIVAVNAGPQGLTLVTSAPGPDSWMASATILHSTDLAHWSSTTLPELTSSNGPLRIVDNGKQVLITVGYALPAGSPADQLPRTVVLVGTPNG